MSKQFIIGTAGHVDHGKTALIKALTDIDCDTHKQEKKRGITINLGFAHIKHPDGYNIGIVDVPGHKDFIDTMVSGAAGIDFVLMIIAADSGIMPQTIEHLKILELLGVTKGIVVLTKIDIVDPLLLEIAEEEVKEYIDRTFLKNSPMIKVSSLTGEGIEELRTAIFNFPDSTQKTDSNDFLSLANSCHSPSRMYIDRSFSLPGKGTIITGSILNGKISNNDFLYLLPVSSKEEIRVKEIQSYGTNVKTADYGSRAALNIKTNSKIDIHKGRMISDTKLMDTATIDATITFFNDLSTNKKTTANWIHAFFLTGSHETLSKIHILFELEANTYLCQIHLKSSCVVRFGDRFILRNTSGNKTLGGGIVLDNNPLKHRKRTEKLKASMLSIASTGLKALLITEVKKNLGLIGIEELANNINLSPHEIKNYIDSVALPGIKVVNIYDNNIILSENKFYNSKFKDIITVIKKYHRLNPLKENGITYEELLNTLELNKYCAGKNYLTYLLDQHKADNKIKYIEGSWALIDHKVALNENLKSNINFIENLFKTSDMTAPIMYQIEDKCDDKKISSIEQKQILAHLASSKKLYRIEDTYIHAEIVDKCRVILINYLKKHNEGITVAGFRDIIDGNRKICLLLLAIFDREKTTLRKDDFRILY
ncbi:MAG TPA: selenocysteine-specific translation elongation factor [Victivallales bacterium]|nr:selenocysteine-specific translation elongation factor [Victivallales bacterium]